MKKMFTKSLGFLLAMLMILSTGSPAVKCLTELPVLLPQTAAKAATVSLNKTTAKINSGSSFTLKLNNGKISSVKSSKTSVATVTKAGKVTGKNAGSATVTVTGTNGKAYKCAVTVSAVLSASSVTLAKGDTKTLTLKGATAKSFKSGKTSVATVTSAGKITAKAAGKATVTVTDTAGRKYSCSVLVEAPALSKTSLSLGAGKTSTLRLNGNTQKVTWTSSSTKVASVSSSGKVTAKTTGKTTVTAKVASGHTYKCTVTVKAALSASSVTLAKGDTKTLTLKGATAKSFKSGKTSVATVSSAGKITAKAAGSATVTVTDTAGNKYTCKVKVEAPVLDHSSVSLKAGKSASLVLKGNTQTVTWTSSDTSVATVSSAGRVTGKKAGTVTIKAKVASGKVCSCKVTVKAWLSKTELPMYINEKAVLTLTGAKKKSVKSSKTSVAKIASDGTVTAVGKGSATITFTDTAGKTYTCAVKVGKPEISQKTLELEVNGTAKLSMKDEPKGLVLWVSDNEEIASVDLMGKVTAKKLGGTVISAYLGDGSAFTCTVNVTDPSVPAHEHQFVTHSASPATCTEDGWKEYRTCKVCEYTSYAPLKASGHSRVTDPAKAPTSSATGLTEGSHCKYCGKIFIAQQEIPAAQPGKICNLTVSDPEFLTGSSENTVYFYAEVDSPATKVALYDAATDSEVCAMVDDGAFTLRGDDIPNDGIYSCKLSVDTSKAEICQYIAKATVKTSSGSTAKLTSPPVYTEVYEAFTQQQLAAFEIFRAKVKETVNTDAFKALTYEEKKAKVENILNAFSLQDIIEEGSVRYDEATGAFSYTLASGIEGTIILKSLEELQRTGDNSAEIPHTVNSVTTNGTGTVGQALILFSFENETFRTSFYKTTETEWDAAGLETDRDMDVTIEDLKHISSDYEVICFSGHGSMLYTKPVMVTNEEVTSATLTQYNEDIAAKRIQPVSLITGESLYCISPSFFEKYYDENSFSNSFIFAECCDFFGESGTYDYGFRDAFLGAGAKALIGFHNSVLAIYCRDFMKNWIDQLMTGVTAKTAFDKCVAKYGADDGQSYNAAIPVFCGTDSAVLLDQSVKNGSFEEASVPKSWNTIGDVRVVAKLGDLTPTDKDRMAMLTTGIGSKEDDYLDGNQGSVMTQTFVIPANAKKLTFSCDMISEEPPEYTDSEYDDKFTVRIKDSSGKVVKNVLQKSVNNVTWKSIDNINFEGGDSTVCHTGWKNVSSDISKYAGKKITLEFLIWDVGDSKFDTVALVDNIAIN